mmetsp:Transcript_79747/g.93216  ORF Transcript_79747/g.93216 Transcript_79747/m.93216 type:complete len:80 (+) Transcript_79747:128-367(+)
MAKRFMICLRFRWQIVIRWDTYCNNNIQPSLLPLRNITQPVRVNIIQLQLLLEVPRQLPSSHTREYFSCSKASHRTELR